MQPSIWNAHPLQRRMGWATQVCAGAKDGPPATPEAMLTRVRRFGRAWSGNFVRLQGPSLYATWAFPQGGLYAIAHKPNHLVW